MNFPIPEGKISIIVVQMVVEINIIKAISRIAKLKVEIYSLRVKI